MNPYMLIGFLALIMGVWFHGNYHGRNTVQLRHAQDVAEALQESYRIEREKQDKINAALQKQSNDLTIINDRLNRDLDRLRKRADRLPQNARTDCQGSTGPELSREDAEFLTREAARADQTRAALEACYLYADSIKDND